MILSNQVRCNACGDEPFSASVHHFQPCKCGAISVDGGTAYLRRVGDISNYTDLSIELNDDAVSAARSRIDWATESGRNSLGILCAVAIALRDSGYEIRKKD